MNRLLNASVITVPSAGVAKLTAAAPTGAALVLVNGVNRLTLRNIGLNRVELLPAASAPSSGSMDYIDPGESATYEWEKAQLDTIFALAATSDTKVVAYQEFVS